MNINTLPCHKVCECKASQLITSYENLNDDEYLVQQCQLCGEKYLKRYYRKKTYKESNQQIKWQFPAV